MTINTGFRLDEQQVEAVKADARKHKTTTSEIIRIIIDKHYKIEPIKL